MGCAWGRSYRNGRALRIQRSEEPLPKGKQPSVLIVIVHSFLNQVPPTYQFLKHAVRVVLILAGFTSARVLADRGPPEGTVSSGESFVHYLEGPARMTGLEYGVDGETKASFSSGGRSFTFDLWPDSVRAGGFSVVVQLPGGSYEPIEPGPVQTFRGVVEEWPGSDVRGSWLQGGIHARIETPTKHVFWLEPVKENSTDEKSYNLRPESTQELGGNCLLLSEDETAESVGDPGFVAGQGLGIVQAELAVDGDYEFYVDMGDALLAANQIEAVLHAANAAYERDVGIRHVITRIIIRTTEDDPYTSEDPATLLRQFADQWRNHHGDGVYDVAQLFTGRPLTGSTIGVAWRYGICNTNSFSVVESGCCGSLSCKSDLTAHELGHNWSAGHCHCGGWTMNATLSCANQFHPEWSAPDIVAYRNARTCLTLVNPFRRLLIEAPAEIQERSSAQLRVVGIPLDGDPIDLTAEAVWQWSPFEAGTIGATGIFRATDVEADLPIMIGATVESEVGSGYTEVALIVRHVPEPGPRIVGSDPPDGSIDARQPRDIGNPQLQGWRTLEVYFNGAVGAIGEDDFRVAHLRTDISPPRIIEIRVMGPTNVKLVFDQSLEPGTWTTITHVASETSVRLGYFPGDVNGDGTRTTDDVRALLEMLSGESVVAPLWSTDINRSGGFDPGDMIRIIDLFNGADSYDPWLVGITR
ncbi:MAG: zinc-dependent metalloprotease family protein [Planctomycetota bacterium]